MRQIAKHLFASKIRCPVGVNNGPDRVETGLPKCPGEQTFRAFVGMSRMCHDRTSPRSDVWQS